MDKDHILVIVQPNWAGISVTGYLINKYGYESEPRWKDWVIDIIFRAEIMSKMTNEMIIAVFRDIETYVRPRVKSIHMIF